MKTAIATLFLFLSVPAFATTWFIRADGGTRYSAKVTTGQCNGTVDTAYPGSGVNQNCAFNDFRYMWDDDSGTAGAGAWVSAVGDTIVIEGCHALATQVNASNPACRIGWDEPTGVNTPPSAWCYTVGNNACYNPQIPNNTTILGACAYGTYTCDPVGESYPFADNLTQIFCGFGLQYCFNLRGASGVSIKGIEFTTHNQHYNGTAWSGNCVRFGSPAYPVGCVSGSQPYDDFADNGLTTSATTTNLTLQDVYIHGFSSSGLNGPIGTGISLTRVAITFNAFSAWNFDDGSDSPDGTSASLSLNYAWFEGNGCYEQYPIVNTQFPARACYDSVSNGFGDSLSGQDAVLASMTCNHCVNLYNTKDAYIGPHTQITASTIENSKWVGSMGAQVKYGATQNATVTFENNLVVSNCARMSQQLPGAVENFGAPPITASSCTSTACTFTTPAQTLFTSGDTVALLNFNGSLSSLDGTSFTVNSGATTTSFSVTVSGHSGAASDTGNAGAKGASLTNYCRAGSNSFQVITRPGSTNHYYGNTIVASNATIVENNCGYYTTGNVFTQESCTGVPNVWTDNVFLGYTSTDSGSTQPGLWYADPGSNIAFTPSYNDEYGIRNGDTCLSNGVICTDPAFVNEPAQGAMPPESVLDGFNFNLASGSGAIRTGITVSGLTTDYNGTTRPNPPSMGAIEYGSSAWTPSWAKGVFF